MLAWCSGIVGIHRVILKGRKKLRREGVGERRREGGREWGRKKRKGKIPLRAVWKEELLEGLGIGMTDRNDHSWLAVSHQQCALHPSFWTVGSRGKGGRTKPFGGGEKLTSHLHTLVFSWQDI